MEQDNTLQQDRSKKFLRAIGLYAIGNLGSRILTFLMVPLYTYFVSSSDYGLYDLYLTLIISVIPLMILQLRDGAFRFMIDNKDVNQRKLVVTFAYKVVITSSLLVIGLGILLSIFHPIRYLWYAIVMLIVMSFYEVVVQMVRGIEDTVCFVKAGILSSVGIGVFSVIFVVLFDSGVTGIFVANILARIVALIYIEVKTKMLQTYFTVRPEYGELKREILRYSLPLLPTMLCWSVITGCDRFFVEHYLGLDVNGMYAVAWRFASILQTLATVFFQAWQEMALTQYYSKDRDVFFSKTMNLYIYVLVYILIISSFLIKVNYDWLVGQEYYDGVVWVFPISTTMMIFALSNFVDLGYQYAKETRKALPALFIATIACLVLNYVLIQYMDVWGVIFGTMLSQLGLFVYRSFDVRRRYFRLSLSKNTFFPVLMLILSSIVYYKIEDITLSVVYLCIVTSLMTFFAPETLKSLVKSKLRISKQ